MIPALSGRTQPFTNTLRDSDGLREEIKDALVAIYCPDRTGASDEASRTASALLDGEPVAGLRGEAAASWLDRYLRATQSCDMATFAKLTAS